MSRKCHRCGVQALEGQTFAFERYPLLGERAYCPGCHRRFLTRLEILSFGFWIIVALVAAIRSQQHGGSPWDPFPVQFTLLLGFAWLVTFPHELGHALAARWAGFRTVRVLIGWGRPLANFRLFGATWMIGCVPFGGLTLPGEPASPPSRRALLGIAGAGLIVNGLLAAAAWLAVQGDLFTGWMRTFAWLFFWSNVWVLVMNAVPRTATTPYGAVQLDGLLLWNLLFHQGEPRAHESAILRRARRMLFTAFKVITLLLLGLAVITFGALIWFLLAVAEKPPGLAARLLLGAFFLILMALSVTMIRRVFRAGLPTAPAALPPLQVRGATALVERSAWQRATQGMVPLQQALATGGAPAATRLEEALQAFPQDPLLLVLRGGQRFNAGDFAGAEADFATALRAAPEVAGDLHAMLLAGLLQAVTHQQDLDRVEVRLNEYLQSSTQRRNQIEVLDHLICDLLYRGLAAASPHAERWARRALELAPGLPTLLGTLGGVLAEQGREAEAEPLLQRCLRESIQLHDQAVAALFLGVLAARKGDRKAAKQLLTRATSLPPQAWLQARAARELAALAKCP